MQSKITINLLALLIPLLGMVSSPANAVDSISFEGGDGNKTRLLRLGMQWNWDKKWFESDNTHLSGYWDLSLANWNGRQYQDQKGEHQNINVIGIAPVFRYQANNHYGPYVEAGVGPHLLSELYDNNKKQLSTRFQFGSLIGIGYSFNQNWEIGLRYQHYSNASIKKPNDGVNFLIGRVGYRF